MSKVFAIHQPNYLPYLGYFYKMAHCDEFVYLDVVQYPRGQSFANRNKIKTANGVTYLTIPVSIPKGEEGKVGYDQVKFADNKWKKKHLRTLEMNYKKTPHFDEVYEIFKNTIENEDSFLELNIKLIESFKNYLDIGTETVRLSNLLENFGHKNEMIIAIANAINADVYLTGSGGGLEYTDADQLKEAGIGLQISDFKHPEYPQLWGDFEANLSIIDLLFNCGKESRQYLL